MTKSTDKKSTTEAQSTHKPTVTKEAGKTDKVADGSSVTAVPEGEGEKLAGTTSGKETVADSAVNPHPAYHINGQPVSKEEYEKSLG